MTTISFSVEDEIAKDFALMAKKRGLSKSDLFREFYRRQAFNYRLNDLQNDMAPVLDKLGIVTDDDFAAYLASDESYEDRIAAVNARKS